jgi:hypothetical protein
MIYTVVALIALIGSGVYLLNRAYWAMVRFKARNVGIFRDDRRDNGLR